jgi:hypothetical protein
VAAGHRACWPTSSWNWRSSDGIPMPSTQSGTSLSGSSGCCWRTIFELGSSPRCQRILTSWPEPCGKGGLRVCSNAHRRNPTAIVASAASSSVAARQASDNRPLLLLRPDSRPQSAFLQDSRLPFQNPNLFWGSGLSVPKVGNFQRRRYGPFVLDSAAWPHSAETGGHVASFWPGTFSRNARTLQPICLGTFRFAHTQPPRVAG